MTNDNAENRCTITRGEVSSEISLLKSATEQTSNIVLITDADMGENGPRIVYVNPSFERITGYTLEEALGKTPRILQGEKTNRELMKDLKEALLKGEHFHGSTVNYKKNGEPYDVEWSISPVRNDEGIITHFVSVQEDITLRKAQEKLLKMYTENLEEEVRIRTQEAVQAEKMASIGLLVAGVAHEINNPVSYLKSNLEFIGEDLEEYAACQNPQKKTEIMEGLKKMLASSKDGANRIAEITNTLKRFAKPDTGDMTTCDINQGIEDTLLISNNVLKNRINVHKELSLTSQCLCRIGELNQVFLNLIINASQAMEKGDIWIRTYEADGQIFIEIEDNGSGIKEEALGKVFDAFFTTKKKGTGLGLSISYKIVESHGGKIEVESKPEKGTKFTIRIPKR